MNFFKLLEGEMTSLGRFKWSFYFINSIAITFFATKPPPLTFIIIPNNDVDLSFVINDKNLEFWFGYFNIFTSIHSRVIAFTQTNTINVFQDRSGIFSEEEVKEQYKRVREEYLSSMFPWWRPFS